MPCQSQIASSREQMQVSQVNPSARYLVSQNPDSLAIRTFQANQPPSPRCYIMGMSQSTFLQSVTDSIGNVMEALDSKSFFGTILSDLTAPRHCRPAMDSNDVERYIQCQVSSKNRNHAETILLMIFVLIVCFVILSVLFVRWVSKVTNNLRASAENKIVNLQQVGVTSRLTARTGQSTRQNLPALPAPQHAALPASEQMAALPALPFSPLSMPPQPFGYGYQLQPYLPLELCQPIELYPRRRSRQDVPDRRRERVTRYASQREQDAGGAETIDLEDW